MRLKKPDNAILLCVYVLLAIPIAIFWIGKTIAGGIAALSGVGRSRYDGIDIDSMDGISFEFFIADLMRHNGFRNVKQTKASGDYGVDVLGEKNGLRYAVQCKRYTGKLGIKPVQEVFAGAEMYGADVCVVATNSTFTQAAETLAQKIGVELWDRKLIETMRV